MRVWVNLFKHNWSYSIYPSYRRFHVRGHRISQSCRQRRPSLTRDHHQTAVGDHPCDQFGRVPRVAQSRVLPPFELDPHILEGTLEPLRSSRVELLVYCPRVNPSGEAVWASDLLALALVQQAHIEVPVRPFQEELNIRYGSYSWATAHQNPPRGSGKLLTR